jgi:trehalose 6-phosphate synthase/phosphatase
MITRRLLMIVATIYTKLLKQVSDISYNRHMDVDITESYTNATKRLLLLDYDGTLGEIAQFPWEAKPTPEILQILTALSKDPRNTVVIVSGRKHEDLEEWFGQLPLAFAAEHGMLFKMPGQDWTITEDINNEWKDPVRNMMQSSVDKLSGSFIEEKTSGLVWHYRAVVGQDDAEQTAAKLAEDLALLASRYNLRVMSGTKIVEVQPLGVSKAIGAKYWLQQGQWDFIMVAGDDTTDEDMFSAAPDMAFTIKIGGGNTVASKRLATPRDMLALLSSLR